MLEKDLEIKSTNKQRRKLVDYYNQWWEEKFGEKGHFKYTMRFDHAHIISKKFGFIQRLVDNNKIDYHNVLRTGYEFEDGVFYHYDDYYCLLMLLSISSSPIEDLISYLK